MEKHK